MLITKEELQSIQIMIQEELKSIANKEDFEHMKAMLNNYLENEM